MKKVLLFLIVGLMLCGCFGPKSREDQLKDLGFEVVDNVFKKGDITINKQLNEKYGSEDVLIQDKIGDNYSNKDLYLKVIKMFIDIPDEVVTKGLDNILDAVKENKRSSEINIFNGEKYFFELFLTEDKTLKITIITPRTYKREKDDTYLTLDDIYGKNYYSAYRRSSNNQKNLDYDELVLKQIFNNEKVKKEEVLNLVEKHALCNPEYICQRYIAYTETNISVLAKNKVYSITYDMSYNNYGTYLLTEHAVDKLDEIADDLKILGGRAGVDLSSYKDQIIKAYTDKDYTLVMDDAHDGKHYNKTVELTKEFKVDMDIYENTIEMSYGYHKD